MAFLLDGAMTHALLIVLVAITLALKILTSVTKLSKATREFIGELREWRVLLAPGISKKRL